MRRREIIAFIVAFALPLAVGAAGAFFTASSVSDWYAGLLLPAFTPPSWVFGPAWTLLYALMGIASFLVWRKGTARNAVRRALGAYGAQLGLNLLWSVVFFGLRNPGVAFMEIVFLWIAIAWTIILFSRVSKSAAWLLAPYALWVAFAAYLNFAIWRMNA